MTTPAHPGRMLFVNSPVGEQAFVMLLSREKAALAAGGSEADGAEDYGFMYSRSFFDLDGHSWQVMWMDPAAAEQGPEPFAASMQDADAAA